MSFPSAEIAGSAVRPVPPVSSTSSALAGCFAWRDQMTRSRSASTAAALMATQPMTLQLRYLQTLSDIGVEKNTTIVFPLPLEMMTLLNKLGTMAPAPAKPAVDKTPE